MNNFICPICFQGLSSGTCPRCLRSFPTKNDISDFRTKSIIEYSDTPILEKIVRESKQENWLNVVQKYTLDQPWLNHIITSQNRADFLYLLNLEDKICLDIGCGWGQITEPLSAMCAKVYATDANPTKVDFVKTRCDQAGYKNNEYFISQTTSLPLGNSTIDVVFLIGVLEWIPDGFQNEDPRKIQLQALQEVKRILKPDGRLIIGIENSHGLKYFAGAPDDHTGIPHISYQDRLTANNMIQQKHHRDYRTYTYNINGYQTLLSESGFNMQDTKFIYPIKSYKDNQALVEIDHLENLTYLYENILPIGIFNEYEKKAVEQELEYLKENNIQELAEKVSSYFIIATK
ncbi:MAG TPA: class I SAM-dependent methyltransferase [bacterium]|nr:class I SAM-dependent methyltransferase [bacterium]